MIINLKPEHEAILNRAEKVGLSREQVLEQAFSAVEASLETEDWLLKNRSELDALLAERLAQAERGELIDGDDVIQVLRSRRAMRRTA
jgi:predicted transcriptional regulator